MLFGLKYMEKSQPLPSIYLEKEGPGGPTGWVLGTTSVFMPHLGNCCSAGMALPGVAQRQFCPFPLSLHPTPLQIEQLNLYVFYIIELLEDFV